MDELDHGGQFEAFRAVEAQRLGEQQYQARPDALAARTDDVARDLVDERHPRRQPFANDGIDLPDGQSVGSAAEVGRTGDSSKGGQGRTV